MHDAYASIYRISMLIFKISQLNCVDIIFFNTVQEITTIKCVGICIKDAVMCFSCVLWTIHSQTIQI